MSAFGIDVSDLIPTVRSCGMEYKCGQASSPTSKANVAYNSMRFGEVVLHPQQWVEVRKDCLSGQDDIDAYQQNVMRLPSL